MEPAVSRSSSRLARSCPTLLAERIASALCRAVAEVRWAMDEQHWAPTTPLPAGASTTTRTVILDLLRHGRAAPRDPWRQPDPDAPGDVAVLPSFTFVATGGGARTARLSPPVLRRAAGHLEPRCRPGWQRRWHRATSGSSSPSTRWGPRPTTRRCGRSADLHGVPLVADSAPSLGGSWQGRPLGTQADAHAFSMSFAKVVSARRAAARSVVPVEALSTAAARPVDWIRSATLGEVHAAAALDLVERSTCSPARRRGGRRLRRARVGRAAGRPAAAADGDDHAWVHWVARFDGVTATGSAKELEAIGVGTKPYYAPVLHRLPWQGFAESAPDLPVTDVLHERRWRCRCPPS